MNYNSIAQLAHDVVLATLQSNDGKHGDEWKTREDIIDLDAAINHLSLQMQHDRSDSHVENAITRLALILARRQQ